MAVRHLRLYVENSTYYKVHQLHKAHGPRKDTRMCISQSTDDSSPVTKLTETKWIRAHSLEYFSK